MKISTILSVVKAKTENVLAKLNIPYFRHIFWDKQAKNIDKIWGDSQRDFDALREVIAIVQPNRLLDFGCGSGRGLKLYHELNISEIYAQDVSPTAIQLSKEKNSQVACHYIVGEIKKNQFEDNFFDLVISTRVLSAVLPSEIENTVAKLCHMSQYVYLNETSEIDKGNETATWYYHDLDPLMTKFGFEKVKTGFIHVPRGTETVTQEWRLFRKK